MHQIAKEIAIFLTIFIVLSLGMHMDKWLSAPTAHWSNLFDHVMPWHPLIYTFIVYLFLGSFRWVFMGIKRLFKKS